MDDGFKPQRGAGARPTDGGLKGGDRLGLVDDSGVFKRSLERGVGKPRVA